MSRLLDRLEELIPERVQDVFGYAFAWVFALALAGVLIYLGVLAIDWLMAPYR